MNLTLWTKVVTGLITVVVLQGLGLANSNCPAISAQRLSELEKFLKAKYEIPPNDEVAIVHVSYGLNSCAEKMSLHDLSDLSISRDFWITSDHKFVSEDLEMIDEEPVLQEKHNFQVHRKRLEQGAERLYGKQSSDTPTLTVFSDFQCPACGRLLELFESEGQESSNLNFRLLIRHYPLMGHQWARPAAELTVCANEQNNSLFWMLHDSFSELLASNAPSDPLIVARNLLEASPLFNQSKFHECMQSGRAKAVVERDMRLASALGISATPTVFVNGINIGAVINGEHLRSVLKQARFDTKQ